MGKEGVSTAKINKRSNLNLSKSGKQLDFNSVKKTGTKMTTPNIRKSASKKSVKNTGERTRKKTINLESPDTSEKRRFDSPTPMNDPEIIQQIERIEDQDDMVFEDPFTKAYS